MNAHSIGIIISRCFGVFYFFKFFQLFILQFVGVLSISYTHENIFHIVWSFTSISLLLLLSLLFWFKAKSISKLLTSDIDSSSKTYDDYEKLFSILIATVGFLFLGFAVPYASEVIAIIFSNEITRDIKMRDQHFIETVITLLLYFVLATFLVFGSKSLCRAIQKVRNNS